MRSRPISRSGNREDLFNAIDNIDPFDTPVMSATRRRNVKNRWFDWQTEFLPVVNGANAQIEGFQLVQDASTPTIRQQNATQISKRDATVSGSQEESDAAGKSSEMAHQIAMVSKVLKSDIETIICSRQQRANGVDGSAPRTTEAICHWLGRATTKLGATAGAVAPRHLGHWLADDPWRSSLAISPFPATGYTSQYYRANAGRWDAARLYERRIADVVGGAARAEADDQHVCWS